MDISQIISSVHHFTKVSHKSRYGTDDLMNPIYFLLPYV